MLKPFSSTGLVWLWVAALVVLLDQTMKSFVVSFLAFGEPLPLLPIFNLTLAFNRGAAFSFLHSASGWQNWVLGGLALIVSIVIVSWLYQLSRRAYFANIAASLILGGAIGNAIDRIRYSYVIDFFDFHIGEWHFAIFNVADSAITIGAVMMCWFWLRHKP
jgi:signal peptidase II